MIVYNIVKHWNVNSSGLKENKEVNDEEVNGNEERRGGGSKGEGGETGGGGIKGKEGEDLDGEERRMRSHLTATSVTINTLVFL